MASYQLIVRGQSGKYTPGDCQAFDLDGNTIEEARLSADRYLVGIRSEWTASWKKDWPGGDMVVQVYLDPEDKVSIDHTVLLDPSVGTATIYDAWIVKKIEGVDIDELRKEIKLWTAQQSRVLEQDPEYQQYLRLKQKFG